MAKTVTFEYAGSTITAFRQTNRKREEIRQLTNRLVKLRGDMIYATLNEFSACVVLPISGDEQVWRRPQATADNDALIQALNYWLDEVDADFTDSLWAAILTPNGRDPITQTTAPEGEGDVDPNSESSERATSKKS